MSSLGQREARKSKPAIRQWVWGRVTREGPVYVPFDRLSIEENTAQDAKETKQTNNRQEAVFELSRQVASLWDSAHIPPALKMAKECALGNRDGPSCLDRRPGGCSRGSSGAVATNQRRQKARWLIGFSIPHPHTLSI